MGEWVSGVLHLSGEAGEGVGGETRWVVRGGDWR